MKAVLMSIQPKWCEKIANGEKTIEVRKTKPKLETPFKVYIYCTLPPKERIFGDYANELIRLQDGKIVYDYGMRLCCDDRPYSKDNFLCKKVIGEFVCDRIDEYRAEFTDLQYPDALDKNVCQNTIKRVEYDDENEEVFYRYETSNEEDNPDDCKFLKESCLTFNEVRKYIGETFFDKPFYGWHISDLKIYDKPKELGEFWTTGHCFNHANTEIVKNIMGDYVEQCWKNSFCRRCRHLDDFGGCGKRGKQLTRPPQSWCYVEELQNG